MSQCLIGLGANKGDRLAQLSHALKLLSKRNDTRLIRTSSWHATRAVGGPAGQGEFLNGAALLETELSPFDLLVVLQEIEAKCGRIRRTRWEERAVDLDLLLHGNRVIQQPGLQVPHPWLAVRSFVLGPSVEIVPEMLHPILSRTISELYQHLTQAEPYLAVTGLPRSGKTRLSREIADKAGATLVTDVRPSPRETSPPSDLDDEIELLEKRADRLMESLRLGPGCHVSDFWIGQSLVHAGTAFGLDQINEFEKAWYGVHAYCRNPKLTLILKQPRDSLTTPAAATMQQEFVTQARRWAGPYLEVDAMDFDLALHDSLAALEAMKFVDIR